MQQLRIKTDYNLEAGALREQEQSRLLTPSWVYWTLYRRREKEALL